MKISKKNLIKPMTLCFGFYRILAAGTEDTVVPTANQEIDIGLNQGSSESNGGQQSDQIDSKKSPEERPEEPIVLEEPQDILMSDDLSNKEKVKIILDTVSGNQEYEKFIKTKKKGSAKKNKIEIKIFFEGKEVCHKEINMNLILESFTENSNERTNTLQKNLFILSYALSEMLDFLKRKKSKKDIKKFKEMCKTHLSDVLKPELLNSFENELETVVNKHLLKEYESNINIDSEAVNNEKKLYPFVYRVIELNLTTGTLQKKDTLTFLKNIIGAISQRTDLESEQKEKLITNLFDNVPEQKKEFMRLITKDAINSNQFEDLFASILNDIELAIFENLNNDFVSLLGQKYIRCFKELDENFFTLVEKIKQNEYNCVLVDNENYYAEIVNGVLIFISGYRLQNGNTQCLILTPYSRYTKTEKDIIDEKRIEQIEKTLLNSLAKKKEKISFSIPVYSLKNNKREIVNITLKDLLYLFNLTVANLQNANHIEE